MRSWKILFLVLGGALIVFGIGVAVGRDTAPDRFGTGIQGTVRFGGCGGSRCASRPQRACQRIMRTRGDEATRSIVARFCSGDDGKYRISLPVGKYLIVSDEPQVGDGLLNINGFVEVRRDGYTSEDLFYDNGMR
jgi:hypothetical protein